jgi:hypothetical protein
LSTPQSKQQLISTRIRQALQKATTDLPVEPAGDEGLRRIEASLLPRMYEAANCADLPEPQAAQGFLNYVKYVLRRLLRPMWDRQTAYNSANAQAVEQLMNCLIDAKREQTNLYLRTLRHSEEKFEGLVRLVEEEIIARDCRIEELEQELSRLSKSPE